MASNGTSRDQNNDVALIPRCLKIFSLRKHVYKFVITTIIIDSPIRQKLKRARQQADCRTEESMRLI